MSSGFWGAFASNAGGGLGSSITGLINPGQYIGLAQGQRRERFAQKQAGIENEMAREQLDLAKLLGTQEYDIKADEQKRRRDFRIAMGSRL